MILPKITSDSELQSIFQRIHLRNFGRRLRKVEAEFRPRRSLSHKIEWDSFNIRVSVSKHYNQAPEIILEIIALILLAKIYRVRVPSELRKSYNAYSKTLQQTLPSRSTQKKVNYQPQGKYLNLIEIFEKMNKIYFNNELKVKHIGWSKNKSYRRLGFYNSEKNLLVISKIFDSRKVPEQVVHYLVYHEMLHIRFPVKTLNGRRIIHSQELISAENDFPGFEQIQKWLKKNISHL